MTPLTRQEARHKAEHEIPTSCAIADDATLEREWGWVFHWDSRRFVETGDAQFRLFGNGPIFVNRFDASVTCWESRLPAPEWIRVYERALAGGGLAGWWRTELLPRLRGRPARSPEPRMPATQDEADRTWRSWDRLNGRYSFLADVTLEDGRLLERVLFDGDTNLAVEWRDLPVRFRFDLVGRPIVALRRIDEAAR